MTRVVLVYLDQRTHEIRQIRSLDGEQQLAHHGDIQGCERVRLPDGSFPIDPDTGKPLHGLKGVGNAITRITGRRPPNTP